LLQKTKQKTRQKEDGKGDRRVAGQVEAESEFGSVVEAKGGALGST